jgi:hypothetical protein
MIFLFQRIIQNHFQWTRPSLGRLGSAGEGVYVQENGFGHEDWNFNTNLLIDNSIYGYCYYTPTEKKREESFNIAFSTYTSGQWYLAGFYLNCRFVEEPPVDSQILNQRMKDLKQLGDSLGKSWRNYTDKKFIKKLSDEALGLRWQVSPENVVRLAQPIAIPKTLYNTKNYRIVSPTQIDTTIFDSLYSLAVNDNPVYDYAEDTEFPEGRMVERRHKSRERNQAVILEAKRQFERKNGQLFCQLCGFDFYKAYGDVGKDFIEAHHAIPLSRLEGEVETKPSDIAMVCSNCHRMLHRKRPWLEMKDLADLIKAMESK